MDTFKPTDKSNFLSMLKSEFLQRQLNKTPVWNIPKRNFLIKMLLGYIDGKAYQIQIPFHVSDGKNIKIGKNFFANWNCTILDHAKVTIGDNVMLAPNVVITSVGHPKWHEDRNVKIMENSFEPQKRGEIEVVAPVSIGNSVWIASNSVVCPGVTIGDNTIIGAGSVVTKDIPANVFACGTPCRVIRKITEQDKMSFSEQ